MGLALSLQLGTPLSPCQLAQGDFFQDDIPRKGPAVPAQGTDMSVAF